MKIKEEISIREIAGERVVIQQGSMGVDMTRVIAFNSTAEWLWNELLDKHFEPADVARLLIDRYGLDEDTATTDAWKWINQCLDAGIIH